MLSKIPKITAIVLFFLAIFLNLSFAQVSTIQVIRSEEVLEKERVLRQKIDEEEKVLIKKITVEGVTLLTEDDIKNIISPFQKEWLTKTKIQQILESIKETYAQNGYKAQLNGISYEVKRKELIIKV